MSAASGNVDVDLSDALSYQRAPWWPVAVDTESRLAAITAGVDADTANWVRDMVDRLEPRGRRARRDVAIRDGVLMTWRGSVSASAKEFASRLQTYAIETYQTDQEQGGPPKHASGQRLAMWDVVRLNGGSPLSWRQMLTIAER